MPGMKMPRAAFDRGMRSVTHTFNCMSTARRRGIYRVAGLLEFALSESDISCQPHCRRSSHFTHPDENVVSRERSTSESVWSLMQPLVPGLPETSRFALFGKNCIVENGVCILADRSALAGSAARMIDLIRIHGARGGRSVE